MTDFTNEFWDWYIGVLSIVSILACALLLWLAGRTTVKSGADKNNDGTTGHVWDEDLRELNNPLPLWWMGLFVITIIFSIVYLIVFPGLGSFTGLLGWSQENEHAQDVKALAAQQAPLYAKYSTQTVEQLSKDPQALKLGERLFTNNCALCHGSEGRGSKAYPNLTNANSAWLGPRDSDHIVKTITEGRIGVMPPMAAAVGDDEKVSDLAHYVLSLSGSPHDLNKAAKGSASFATCSACHGADGRGNKVLGAPNLTDAYWLYGPGEESIKQSILKGRNNVMPSQIGKLSPEQVRIVSAYVLTLGPKQSNQP
jgi:cytochrome c oxidase cbb3-type subunit III